MSPLALFPHLLAPSLAETAHEDGVLGLDVRGERETYVSPGGGTVEIAAELALTCREGVDAFTLRWHLERALAGRVEAARIGDPEPGPEPGTLVVPVSARITMEF